MCPESPSSAEAVPRAIDTAWPPPSSSSTVTATVPVTLPKPPPAAACVRVAASSVASSSSPALTVTAWGVSQLPLVKVSVFWSPFMPGSVSTVTSPEAPATVTVTSAVGWSRRFTV